MPGLNGGNTCWGNRKSFNMYGEYVGDSFLGLDYRENEIMRSSSRNSSNSITFTSSNTYHGYHRVFDSINRDEEMIEHMSVDNNVSEQKLNNGYEDVNTNVLCRKRPSLDQSCAIVKRFRHDETTESFTNPYTIYCSL